jgi:hypothetical protein
MKMQNFSLEGCCSTIELYPRLTRSTITPGKPPQPPCTDRCGKRPLFRSPDAPLNISRFRAYTEVSINNERR